MTDQEDTPAVWMVRGGSAGEFEETASSHDLTMVHFGVSDLSEAKDRAAIREVITSSQPGMKKGRVRSLTGQLTSFRLRMQRGDYVAMPLKGNPGQVACGKIAGPYEYKRLGEQHFHCRSVDWFGDTITKSDFREDIVRRLGLPSTIVQIHVPDAAERFQAVIDGRPETAEEAIETDVEEESYLAIDPEERILDYIRDQFREHRFAELVEAVLLADGYATLFSPPGPDGGVDILAGRGRLGFDAPHLCVQVKATEKPIGTPDLDRLCGAMEKHGADLGLFVSWSGFTKPALDEGKRMYFRLRLWSGRDLLNEIFRLYDQLSLEIRAELPLKQIWTLVSDDPES